MPSSKHGIGAMVIHPILGIITMGLLNPIDGPGSGRMTIPFYEKTNHVLTTAHMEISAIHKFPNEHDLLSWCLFFSNVFINLLEHNGAGLQAFGRLRSINDAFASRFHLGCVEKKWNCQGLGTHQKLLLVLNVGNGWVAGGCWDDYY